MSFSRYDTINRIIQILDEHYMTGSAFSKTFGVSYSTVSDWKRGKSTPSAEIICKISEYFHVSTDYLLKGEKKEEELFRLRVASKHEHDLLEKYRALPKEFKDMTVTYINTLADATSVTPQSVTREKKAN